MTDEAVPGTKTTLRAIHGRVFELRCDVTGYLEGELADWPSNIQDAVYAAMERVMAKAKATTLYILHSRCGRDVPEEPYHVIVTCAEAPKLVIEDQRRLTN